MSQTVYRELHPPTAVTHCVEAFFTHPAPAAKGGEAAGAAAPNLIVARGTRLEVYALNYGPGPSLGRCSTSTAPSNTGNCRLELVGSYPCWGLVCDLAVLRGKGGSSGQRDSILVAVRDAKLSVVEWNAELHCLRNGSLHSFEGDPALREACPGGSSLGSGSNLVTVPPLVATDPGGRCAAALLYGRQLAILPAFQADVLDQLERQDGIKSMRDCATVGNSYCVNLGKVPSLKLTSATAVRGMAFMHGFTEPLLALLHETTPTWGARLKEAHDACSLSALSINMRKKRQPVIWSVPQLPSDACGLMAVPRGGVLVLSQNLLLYYAQGGSCVMAINSNAFAGEVPPRLDAPALPTLPAYARADAERFQAAASATALEKAVSTATNHAKQWAANVHPETVASAARGAPKAPGLELEADGAMGCWIADNVALLSLKTGQLLLLSLRFEGAAASKMQVAVVGSAPVASCAVRLTQDLLFLGSSVGDSLLIHCTRDSPTAAAAAAGAAAGAAGGAQHPGEPPAKRRRLASLASADMGGAEGQVLRGRRPGSFSAGPGGSSAAAAIAAAAAAGAEFGDEFGIDGEWELYRSATGRSSSMRLPALVGDSLKYNFRVLDSLMGLGPVRSTVVTDLHLRESDVHASLSGATGHQANPSSCLVAAVGADKSGALAILRRGVVTDVITAVPNLAAHGAWTLHYRPQQEGAQKEAAGGAPSGQAHEGSPQPGPDSSSTQQQGAEAVDVGSAGTGNGPGGAAEDDADKSTAAETAAADGAAAGARSPAPATAGTAAAAVPAGPGSGAAGAQDGGDAAVDVGSSHHAFLLLSCGGSQTMVLDARGPELAEVLNDVAFVRDAPTIAVGEVFGASAAVQVTHHTVRLVRGTAELLEELTLTELLQQAQHPAAAAVAAATAAAASSSTHASQALNLKAPVCIKFAQVKAPYVLLMMSDSTVLLLQAYRQQQPQQQQQCRLQLLRAALPELAEAGWAEPLGAATAACIYTDSSGWLAQAVGLQGTAEDGTRREQQQDTAAGAGAAGAGTGGGEEDDDADVAMLMAEAAAGASAAGDSPEAAAADGPAAAVAAGTADDTTVQQQGEQTKVDHAAGAVRGDVDKTEAKQAPVKQDQGSGEGAAAAAAAGTPPAGAAAGDTAPAAAAAAAAAAKPEVQSKALSGIRLPPGLAPSSAAAAAAVGAAGGLDDDADGMLQGGAAGAPAAPAATEAVQSAAAVAAVAAEDAATAAGATARGRAIAGSKAADAVFEAAAAGGEEAALQQQQQQQEQTGLAAAASMKTPFQSAAAAGIDDDAVGLGLAGNGAGPHSQQQRAAGAAGAAQAGSQLPLLPQQQQAEVPVLSFVCVIRAGGGLQVFALPQMQVVFEDGEAVLGHQVLSPCRHPSIYEEDVSDAELSPSPISEVLLECFAQPSGGAIGVAAAAAPLMVLLRDDGSMLAYKAFKPDGGILGFRQLPLGPAVLGHESPAPPPASSPSTAVSGIPGMPEATSAPCRLVRFDHLATPRLDPPLGPGLRPPAAGLYPAGSSLGSVDSLSAAGAVRGSGSSAAGPQLHYSGVLVCGPKPLWLVAARGGFFVHPMEGGMGAVDAFCGFHNINCPYGYIAAALKGDMKICTLPLQLRLDQPWLSCKLPLRSSPLALTVYPDFHLLAVATSRLSAPPRPFLPPESGGDPVAAAAYATADAAAKAAGVEELNEVMLLAPPGFGLRMNSYISVWEALSSAAAVAATGSAAGSTVAGEGGAGAGGVLASVAGMGGAAGAAGSAARVAAAVAAAAGWAGLPVWRHSLLPGEDIMAIKTVELKEGGNDAEQAEPFIAVGCASTFGEDYPALGRVLLLQVSSQHIFHLEGSQTKITARVALQRELAGPVMAVESLRGYLILAVGFRMEMHFKQGNTLVKVGQFVDSPSLVSGISIVKDFMLVGTAAHSCQFMRYKEKMEAGVRNQTLAIMSADVNRVEAWAVEFLVNHKKLLLVVTDGGGNLSVMTYDKQDPDSWDGQKLLRRGAAHTGSWVTSLIRMHLHNTDAANRQALLCASAQGGLLLLSPLWDEAMFRRMTSLYEELVYRLQHTAGLNPKAFQSRYVRAGPAYGAGFYPVEPLQPGNNSLLQGDVLWSFADMDQRAQAAVAMAVGCDVSDLLQDLQAMTVVADLL